MILLILALHIPKIDAGAMALLKKNRDAMHELHSYRAQCQLVTKTLRVKPGYVAMPNQFSTLTAAKPNLMRYEMWETSKSTASKPSGPPAFAMVSNGKKKWTQFHKNYSVAQPVDPAELQTAMEPWEGFYVSDRTLYEQAQSHLQKKNDVVVKRLGREKIGALACDKIEINVTEDRGTETVKTRTIVFLRPDGLVRRETVDTIIGRDTYSMTCNLLNIEKNPTLRNQSYAYTPPKGGKLVDLPKADEATSHGYLLANGTPAPDLTAKDIDGKAIRLSDLKGKVVVLDFWASWCGPCLDSMPHTQAVADKLKKEGIPLVVLAVDDAEKSEAFSGWVKSKGAKKYPALTFLYSPQDDHLSSKLFKVSGIPCQYIIDADGTIRSTLVGYSGETDTLEKSIRAAYKAN